MYVASCTLVNIRVVVLCDSWHTIDCDIMVYTRITFNSISYKSCYCYQLDDVALEGLMNRCSNIRHLSLSWTGGGGQITEPSLCRWDLN